MVRTRSFGVKAGGKSSKKTASSSPVPASSTGGSSGSKKNENGNTVQAQPTPAWQREITGFLGNPSKKPRLEDDESNTSTKEDAVEAETTAEGDKAADSKVEDDSLNGSNTTKENVSSDVSGKDIADSISKSGNKEKEEVKSGPTEKGSGDSTNGCKTTDEGSTIIKEDLPLEKDDSKKVGKNGSVSPALADGEKNND